MTHTGVTPRFTSTFVRGLSPVRKRREIARKHCGAVNCVCSLEGGSDLPALARRGEHPARRARSRAANDPLGPAPRREADVTRLMENSRLRTDYKDLRVLTHSAPLRALRENSKICPMSGTCIFHKVCKIMDVTKDAQHG